MPRESKRKIINPRNQKRAMDRAEGPEQRVFCGEDHTKLGEVIGGICVHLRKPAAGPYALTSEPIFSPVTTFLMFPRSFRLKTMIGRLLSLQSEIAVESITFSPCFRTSM